MSDLDPPRLAKWAQRGPMQGPSQARLPPARDQGGATPAVPQFPLQEGNSE